MKSVDRSEKKERWDARKEITDPSETRGLRFSIFSGMTGENGSHYNPEISDSWQAIERKAGVKTKILVAFATTMSSTREVAGAVAEVQRALRDVWAAGAGKETHSERLATIIHGKEKKSWREN